jgi:hypothetical protein
LLALPLQRSGFNRFYQHFRWKSPIAGKTFAHKKQKTRHNTRVFIQNFKIHSNFTQTLAMRMMVVMTTMMTAIGVHRNHSTSENDDCNGSNK